MNQKLKCLVCLAVACYCVGGPVLADNDNAKDLGKGVVYAYATATSLSVSSDFSRAVYIANTNGPGEFNAAPVVDFKREHLSMRPNTITPQKK